MGRKIEKLFPFRDWKEKFNLLTAYKLLKILIIDLC